MCDMCRIGKVLEIKSISVLSQYFSSINELPVHIDLCYFLLKKSVFNRVNTECKYISDYEEQRSIVTYLTIWFFYCKEIKGQV